MRGCCPAKTWSYYPTWQYLLKYLCWYIHGEWVFTVSHQPGSIPQVPVFLKRKQTATVTATLHLSVCILLFCRYPCPDTRTVLLGQTKDWSGRVSWTGQQMPRNKQTGENIVILYPKHFPSNEWFVVPEPGTSLVTFHSPEWISFSWCCLVKYWPVVLNPHKSSAASVLRCWRA